MSKKQLLVEGKDDQHVTYAIRDRFNISKNFEVIDCTGLEPLVEQISVRLKQSEIETIGIIIDADTEIQNRWTSLKNILSSQGYILPDTIPANGLIISENDKPKIGAWIMPNNNLNGMLEDFIAFLVPQDDMLMPYVTNTLDEIERNNLHLNKYNTHRAKAKIHTWLALQEEPGTPLGSSITKRYLTTDIEICRRFADWMGNLFNL
jgi:hypothetical protein